jgi:CheY-like chemotaxis protein
MDARYGSPRFDTDGTFLGYIGSCIDINALKHEEPGLKGTVATRDMALDAWDRIASSIAHEFKNLVGALVGDLWAIRKNAHDPAAVRQRAEEAEDAAIRGERAVEELLAAVRRPKSETVHVNRLITEAWTIFRGAAGDRVSMKMELAAEPDDVIVDPSHLQAALLNLVTNARDAMAKGGAIAIATRNVVVRLEAIDEPDLARGRYVMVAVSDIGVGMSDKVQRQAFENFTTKPAGQGTGIGLSQVRTFARHSRGTVRIESAPGKGTTVRIYLPQAITCTRRSRREPFVGEEQAMTTSRSIGRSSLVVLVVEDNDRIRNAEAEALSSCGYNVVTATDTNAALQLLTDLRVDLLVTDIRLPGSLDGIALARSAKQRWPGIKVLLVGGDVDQFTHEDLHPIVDDMLQKPFKIDELRERVTNLSDLRCAPRSILPDLFPQNTDPT